MILIPASANKIMPWKNGLGTTREIDISPVDADFSAGQFDFRLSSATVSTTSPFSKFPGFDRILCVIRGEGLLINEERHELFQPFHFAGEKEIIGSPLGSVIDLGIIYRRDRYHGSMTKIETSQDLHLPEGIHYLFCAQGKINTTIHAMNEGDTLKISQLTDCKISLMENAIGFLISLKTI